MVIGREGFHNDPAARFSAATALVWRYTQLTPGREILSWHGDPQRVGVRRGGLTPP